LRGGCLRIDSWRLVGPDLELSGKTKIEFWRSCFDLGSAGRQPPPAWRMFNDRIRMGRIGFAGTLGIRPPFRLRSASGDDSVAAYRFLTDPAKMVSF